MQLTATLDASVGLLEQRGVLKKIAPESLPRQIMKIGGLDNNSFAGINILALSCCDGHQFMDVTQHTFRCCETAKKGLGLEGLSDDCFHWRTENGGPFVLSVPKLTERKYKEHFVRVDYDVLGSLQEGLSLKKLNVVLLIGHCICGKMMPLVERFEDYVSYMVRSKARIMQEFNLPSEQVIAQLQCHRLSGKRHTFHIDYSEAASLPALAA